ncbi:MAG: peptide ABC transporter permease, partial [Methylophilales bacterium 16-45-7]
MRLDMIKKALSNPLALAGFIIILTIFLLAMLAPIISPYDPDEINVKAILLGPSWSHWMGTDG